MCSLGRLTPIAISCWLPGISLLQREARAAPLQRQVVAVERVVAVVEAVLDAVALLLMPVPVPATPHPRQAQQHLQQPQRALVADVVVRAEVVAVEAEAEAALALPRQTQCGRLRKQHWRQPFKRARPSDICGLPRVPGTRCDTLTG